MVRHLGELRSLAGSGEGLGGTWKGHQPRVPARHAARAIVGHASHKTNEIHAEIDVNLAREAMAYFG